MRARSRPHLLRLVTWIALALLVVGVFSTWTRHGLVLVVAAGATLALVAAFRGFELLRSRPGG